MKKTAIYFVPIFAMLIATAMSCANKADTVKQEPMTQGNPYLPLWEHIPAEPL